jgi:hypothetical protein
MLHVGWMHLLNRADNQCPFAIRSTGSVSAGGSCTARADACWERATYTHTVASAAANLPAAGGGKAVALVAGSIIFLHTVRRCT